MNLQAIVACAIRLSKTPTPLADAWHWYMPSSAIRDSTYSEPLDNSCLAQHKHMKLELSWSEPDIDKNTRQNSRQVTRKYTTYRVPSLLLRKNFRASKTSKTFFQDYSTFHTAHMILNLLYMVSSTTNTLDQVYCKQRCNTRMHYIWSAKYFKICCHFVSVSKSSNSALHMLVILNHN